MITIIFAVLFINVVVIFQTNEYLTMPLKVSKELKIAMFHQIIRCFNRHFLLLFFSSLLTKLPLEKSHCEDTMPRFTGICLFHLSCVTCEEFLAETGGTLEVSCVTCLFLPVAHKALSVRCQYTLCRDQTMSYL